jgi:hypothetical protein
VVSHPRLRDQRSRICRTTIFEFVLAFGGVITLASPALALTGSLTASWLGRSVDGFGDNPI